MTTTARLQDVAEINPRTPESIRSRNSRELVPFVAMSSVSEYGTASFETTRPLGDVLNGYTYFERGDLLLAKITPCFENGKAAQLTHLPHEFGFGSTEFHVVRPSADVDSRYLFHALWNDRIRSLGAGRMTGSAGQKRLPADFLKSTRIPLPSLPEQGRIATILDKADAVRRSRLQVIVQLRLFEASAFEAMFGNPVTNERGWPNRKLGDLAVIRRGASPRPIEHFMGGTIPWIKIGDATAAPGLYIDRAAEFVTEAGAARSVMLAPNAIVVANSGVSLGFARILRIAGCIHDGWLSIENLSTELRPEYFVAAINVMTTHLRRIAPKGTQPNLNIGIASALAIPIPPLSLQDAFIAFLGATNRLENSQRSSAVQVDRLLESLTQRYLTTS